ncbi:filamentous hemagglutinin N-terminal domain-containing protein, partial [Saccharospirillum sp. HFRX-1]
MTLPGIFERTRFPRAALATAILAATASLGRAGPTGGEVVAGSGSISQPDASTTNVQQNSDKLVVEWQSFDVDTGEAVNFFQPSSDALVLNQILNGDVSVIRGQINANGQVILVNPNGVYFGSTAQLSVGSLVASGHAIATDDFLDGELNFERQDGTAGSVINHGTIEAATGGSVTLLGSRVENHGYIVAHAGRINLAVGDRIALDFDGDGLMRFSVDAALLENFSGADSAITNSGDLLANGGTIVLEGQVAQDIFAQVVNNEGIIKAGRIDNSGGVISLVGRGGRDSSVVNSGQIDASALDANSDGGQITLHAEDSTLLVQDGSRISADSNNQQGGQVHLLGDQIALTGDAEVDASGELGGGEILIGGDYQGKNPDIPNAEKVIVGSGVLLNADANRQGDGGRIIVWADNWTRFGGSLSARGGSEGGDGGFAEVSGKQNLAYFGMADLSAALGKFGVLLLDPENITIVATDPGANDDDLALDNGNMTFDDQVGGDFEISAQTINEQSADVVLKADADITQNEFADINITNPGTSITLEAGDDITLNAGITTNGGDISLFANSATAGSGGASGNGAVSVSSSGLTSGGGDINLSGNALTISGDVDASGGAGTGAVSMSADGDISLGADVTSGGTQTFNGALKLTADVELNADDDDIEFTSTINDTSSERLTVDAGTGAVNFDGAIGDENALTSLTVTGATITLSTHVETAGMQTYTGAVVLAGNVELTTADSNITFNGTIDGDSDGGNGRESLTLTTGLGGTAIFHDTVGSADSLASLTANNAVSLGADITTFGAQTYNGAVTLADTGTDAVLLTSSDNNITLSSTVDGAADGAQELTVDTANGLARFEGEVGGLHSLASLTINHQASLGADITTTGAQSFSGAVTLAEDVTLNTTNDNITFSSTIDSEASEDNTLTLNAGNGTVTLSDTVGGSADGELGALDASQATGSIIIGGDVTTSGTQSYAGAVTLDGDRTFTGTNIQFGSSVAGNGDDDDSLDINGNLDLDGAVSGVTTLDVSGTSNLADDVTTSGKQTYTGAVTLSDDVNLNADDDAIMFGSTISGSGHALDVDAGTSTVTFGNDATGVEDESVSVGSLSVTANAIHINDNISTDIANTGAQSYTGAVTLNDDVTLTTDNSAITFNSTIDSEATEENTLDLDAGTGTVTLSGTLGGGTDGELGSVDASGSNGSIVLGGDVTTTGTQQYGGAVTLDGDRTFTGTNIQFGSSVAGNGGDDDSLDIAGDLDLDGAVSGVTTLDVSGTSNLAADVTTSGKQTYTGAV